MIVRSYFIIPVYTTKIQFIFKIQLCDIFNMNCRIPLVFLRNSAKCTELSGRASAPVRGACLGTHLSRPDGIVPCTTNYVPARQNYTHIELARSSQFKLSHRSLPHPKDKVQQTASSQSRMKMPEEFRHIYPEFLPLPVMEFRNKLSEKIERQEMLARRSVIDIPEFYVGSVLAVTVSDPHATGKSNRFMGLCIERGGAGLRAWFTIRNVVDHQGIEIMYDMYCPLVTSIECLRLEKRLDGNLIYLRDALPEYSTFPQDMEQEMVPEGAVVPVNALKVKMIPKPWHREWERKELQGIDFEDHLTDDMIYEAEQRRTQDYEQYDLMKEYRATIPLEEQEAIFSEVANHYPRLRRAQRNYRRSRDQ